jgi:hypothetical protein
MVPAKRLGKEQAVVDHRTNLEPAFVSAIVRYGMGTAGYVVVDASLTDSAAFADAWDVQARIDRMALLTQWPQVQAAMGAAGTVSGLTRASDLPLVMQLVSLQGARVLFRSEHDARAAGALQHQVREQRVALPSVLAAADAWSVRLGAQLAALGRPVAPAPASLRCAAGAAQTCGADYLVGWSIAYGAI